ncbi:hypothetical protein TBLA_0E00830 [Henningerozyma blattae CBS 6284]|uniref:Uncharacterized protein n=1 Tax=Henningerozyma blattae (strain ATCC 34711 / CBS 6284 / DSM 70876 / NBRC 10599 / NRRL Y-10934 / UCD 77-7) TaxID=1071380 RepID=I2H442_HENB6|nr:hypothetical protein TBLA_0E00830 [Tetrapisispora blattae CBS 6284]CCH61144.1 hypothetical protein TBLA_0E00830 [Tetrapisispora blattae CBS 6284]
MFDSVQKLVTDLFNSGDNYERKHRRDPRKVDYGNLNDIKARSRYFPKSSHRPSSNNISNTRNNTIPNRIDRVKFEDFQNDSRSKSIKRSSNKNSKNYVTDKHRNLLTHNHDKIPTLKRKQLKTRKLHNYFLKKSSLYSIWEFILQIFSNDAHDLKSIRNTSKPLIESPDISTSNDKLIRDRIGRSQAFRNKIQEFKKKDRTSSKQQPKRLRKRLPINIDSARLLRNPPISKKTHNTTIPYNEDNLTLNNKYFDEVNQLKRKIKKLASELENKDSELEKIRIQLKFANEKNQLREDLLDDAKLDNGYLISRRQIKNLEKQNVKPKEELIYSPVRIPNPKYTSSPMNKPGTYDSNPFNYIGEPKTPYLYDKYRKLPETEQLNKLQIQETIPSNDNDSGEDISLSPVAVDISKYSSH